METTAIIQFIGIVLFSASIPGDPGVHAVLPRIGGTASTVSFMPEGIEEHKAYILYRTADLIQKSAQWTSQNAPGKGWQYVELDGELVQFLTDAGNDDPAIPPALPRIGRGTCLLNTVPPTLTWTFLPSTSYKGAIGVFDIPNGTLDGCLSTGNRTDTRLFLQTKNMVVISAKKAGEDKAKSITLDQDAVVYVVNAPARYVVGPSLAGHEHDGTEPHWAAYNAMLGKTCASRPDPAVPALPRCGTGSTRTSAAYITAWNNPPSEGITNILDPQCSNTQWP